MAALSRKLNIARFGLLVSDSVVELARYSRLSMLMVIKLGSCQAQSAAVIN
jgi:hypothetical protein